MKKRMISLFLATVLLLCGCAADPQPTETTPASTEGSTAGTTQPVDYMQNVLDLAQIPEDPEPQPLLIDYDPDRKIYIQLANNNSDFFPHREGGNYTQFQLYSREPLTEEDIQFQIPCQTEYEILIQDGSRSFTPEANWSHGVYVNLAYLLHLGTDFGELQRYSMISSAAGQLSRESRNNADIEDADAYKKIDEEYTAKHDSLLGQLNSLKVENFPDRPVYAYVITITFSKYESNYKIYDETVETIDIIIKGEKHTVDVGQWRFHSQLPDDLTEAMETFLENRESGKSHSRTTRQISPYDGGYAYCDSAYAFTAEEDMTLLGVEQVFGGEDPINILGARVTVKGTEYFWDLERPLEISKGDAVKIDLYFRDELFENIYSFAHTTFRLDCQIRQNVIPKLTFINMRVSTIGAYGSYLMAFEGVDLSNYFYWNYSYDDEDFAAMPEEWRQ